MVDTALGLARTWCAGHVIDEAPALAHAVRVAVTLDRHLTPAPPGLLAAALLHDAPDYAPPDINLDDLLLLRFGPDVVRVVRAVEREHRGLDSGPGGPPIPIDDPWVLYASAADKLVALTSTLRRAAKAPDPQLFWARRRAFCDLVPYFRTFHTTAAPHLPATLATALDTIVTGVEHAIAATTTAQPDTNAAGKGPRRRPEHPPPHTGRGRR